MTKEWLFYLKTGVFGAIVFGLGYLYLRLTGTPSEVNKSLADTSVVLMGFSMMLSSVCYFWNFLDWAIVYRKYLGLIGFAFALAHLILSWGAFLALFNIVTWQQSKMWPALMGTIALLIFTVMALVSNAFAARRLGGKYWRYVLRTGYFAMALVWVHVVLLKSSRWITWFQGGVKSPPSLSLLVSLFIIVVIVMRIALWWSLKRRSTPTGVSLADHPDTN